MFSYPYSIDKNDPLFKGALAGRKMLFGEGSRYAIAPVHTRFDDVEWFVWDAEILEHGCVARVIRQAQDVATAIEGIDPSQLYEVF